MNMTAQDRIALMLGRMIIEGEVKTDELNAAKVKLEAMQKDKTDGSV